VLARDPRLLRLRRGRSKHKADLRKDQIFTFVELAHDHFLAAAMCGKDCLECWQGTVRGYVWSFTSASFNLAFGFPTHHRCLLFAAVNKHTLCYFFVSTSH
jgi:hypothetical protein